MKKMFLILALFCFSHIIFSDELDNKIVTDKSINFEKSTVQIFKSIPILSDGRVKPLNTYASFILLRINGKRVISDSVFKEDSGEIIQARDLLINDKRYSKQEPLKKIQAMEWFLTVLFYPDQAMHQRIFLVDNSEVLESCGAKNIEARDRYSYAELEPLKQELFKKAGEIEEKESKKQKLTLLEQQTLRLGINMLEFLRIAKALDFARPMKETSEPGLDLHKPSRYVIANILAIQKKIQSTKDFESLPIEKQNKFKEELDNISTDALELFHQANWFTIFPPRDPKSKSWDSTYDLFIKNEPNKNGFDSAVILSSFEEICMAISSQKETPDSFRKLAETLNTQIDTHAASFKEINRIRDSFLENLNWITFWISTICSLLYALYFFFIKPNTKALNLPDFKWTMIYNIFFIIPLVVLGSIIIDDRIGKISAENLYYKIDLIYYSLLFFIASFLLICFSFFKLNSKAWNTINIIILNIPIAMLVSAITMRCCILGRPPVATLYETILFITAIICLASIGIEFIFKNKIALFMTSVVGTSGLFLSYAYEKGDGTDTMGNLAAVLNSNFWLATHVTAVTIGYSAGLLAAIIAHIYFVAKVFRLSSDQEFYKNLHKMMYGVLCFCTLFATVGTILGGIWANYSWGRFWGWDPKENGALAIVLWNLIILHGRLGGIFKEFGIAIMCVFGGMVVVASWWGVNQLGVGLHSYGFTDGIVNNLIIFAVLELSFIAIAFFHHYVIERLKTTR